MSQVHATPDNAISVLSGALPTMYGRALGLIQARRLAPITVYLDLVQTAPFLDLRAEEALTFRTRFNGFYGVRRNQAWRYGFYAQFEAMKVAPVPAAKLFERHLSAIHVETHRVEASFVSKAVATLNPSSPVIDKILRDRFASVVASPPFGGGLSEALAYYRWLAAVMTGLSRTSQAAAWFMRFDTEFGHVAGATGINPVKKLDFLIWAGRPPASARTL